MKFTKSILTLFVLLIAAVMIMPVTAIGNVHTLTNSNSGMFASQKITGTQSGSYNDQTGLNVNNGNL